MKHLAAHIYNYELNVYFRRQVVATTKISPFSNHRNAFCSDYWNL